MRRQSVGGPGVIRKAIFLAALAAAPRALARPVEAPDLLAPPGDPRVRRELADLEKLTTEELAPPALASVLRRLKDKSPEVRASALSLLERKEVALQAVLPPLRAALGDRDPRVRATAGYVLGERGAEAVSAAPALIKSLSDEKLGGLAAESAEEALQKLGPGVVGPLLAALPRVRGDARPRLFRVLIRFSPDEGLRALLRERDPGLLLSVGRAMPARSWAELISTLANPGAGSPTRANAALLLGQPGVIDDVGARGALERAVHDGDVLVALEAGEALSSAGGSRDLEPAILSGLRHASPAVRGRAAALLSRRGAPPSRQMVQALSAITTDPNRVVRRQVCQALGRAWSLLSEPERALLLERRGKDREHLFEDLLSWGPPPSTIPKLLELLDRQADRSSFFEKMNALGGEAVRAILPSLEDRRANVRQSAVETLARMGGSAVSAVPALARSLRDPDGKVQLVAGWALGRIGPPAVAAAPQLLETMAGKGKMVDVAEAALVDLGPAAVPLLLPGLRHKDEQVRLRCARIIGETETADARARQSLVALLQDPAASVRVAGVSAVARVSPRDPVARRALLGALSDSVLAVRKRAIEALGSLGPQAKEAIGPLAMAAQDREAEVRMAALMALARVGPRDQLAIEALVSALGDKVIGVRTKAAEMLGSLGAAAKQAIGSLTQAARDPKVKVRIAAARALVAVEPGQSMPVLIGLVGDRSAQVQSAAVALLKQAGPRAGTAVPTLLARLKKSVERRSWGIMEGAALALWEIAHDPKLLLPSIASALTFASTVDLEHDDAADLEGRISSAAASLRVIRAMGPRAAPLAASLLRYLPALEKDSLTLPGWSAAADAAREAIVHQLGRMGPAVLPELVAALASRQPEVVRHSAALALTEVGQSTPEVRGALEAALKDRSKGVVEAARQALEKLAEKKR